MQLCVDFSQWEGSLCAVYMCITCNKTSYWFMLMFHPEIVHIHENAGAWTTWLCKVKFTMKFHSDACSFLLQIFRSDEQVFLTVLLGL